MRAAVVSVLVFTVLCGVAYPLAVTGAAQVLFAGKADGSLVERHGRVVGSRLIGQDFSKRADLFQSRPSVTGYDPSATAAPASPTPVPQVTGPLHWAQWPAYIDLTGKAGEKGEYAPGSSPTLEQFKKQYKVDVNYEEKIEANEDFYATIQQQLVAGVPTGWDMITITDWLAAKIISKNWAEQIDQSAVPN